MKRWRGGQMIPALGCECTTGSGAALPAGSRLPRMRHLIAALDALAPPEVDVEQVA